MRKILSNETLDYKKKTQNAQGTDVTLDYKRKQNAQVTNLTIDKRKLTIPQILT